VVEHSRARRAEIGAARSQRTRLRLIEAAARVIGLQGEHMPAIEDFIREAGVSRGTFYKHFATRHDLMVALWEKVGRDPYRQTWIAYAGVPDRAERVMIGVKHQLLRATRNPAWGWLVLRIWLEEGEMYEDILRLARADIDAGKKEGRFTFLDSGYAANLVFGALMGATKTILTSNPEEDFIVEATTMILRLLGLTIEESRRVALLPLPELVAGSLSNG